MSYDRQPLATNEVQPGPTTARRCVSIVMGFFLLVTGGIVYSVGVWKEALAESAGWSDPNDPNQLKTKLALMMSAMNLGVYCPIHLGLFIDKFGQHASFFLSGFLMFIGYETLWYLSTMEEPGDYRIGVLAFFLIGQGAFTVFAQGVATNIDLFPASKGLVQGFLLGGFGISAAVWSQLYKRDWGFAGEDVSGYLRFTGIFCAAVVGIGMVISVRPVPKRPQSGDAEEAALISKSTEVNYTPLQCLNSGMFWILYAILAVVLGTCICSIQSMAQVARAQVGGSGADAADVVFVISIFNLLGRWVGGWLSDVFENTLKISRTGVLTVGAVLCIAMAWVLKGENLTSGDLYLAGVLIGASEGFVFGVWPAICRQLYGSKYYGINLGILMTSIAVGSNFCTVLFGKYQSKPDEIQSVSTIYNLFFAAAVVITFVSIIPIMVLKVGQAPRLFFMF